LDSARIPQTILFVADCSAESQDRLRIRKEESKTDLFYPSISSQAGWKFMGITALQLGATLLVADKVLTGDDKKKMNMGIAAGGAAAAGMFAVNGFCTDMVKPEMRIMNAIGNAAVAGLAIKALMEK